MTDSQPYPQPGLELDELAAAATIAEFRGHFTSQGGLPNWKGEKRPAWCDFKASLNVERLSLSAVQTLLASGDSLRFYVEFASRVRLANAVSIAAWFEHRPRWVEPDVYIFPADLSWCLVFTHDSEYLLASTAMLGAPGEPTAPLTPPN